MTYHVTLLTTGGQRYYITVDADSEQNARRWVEENLSDVAHIVHVYTQGT